MVKNRQLVPDFQFQRDINFNISNDIQDSQKFLRNILQNHSEMQRTKNRLPLIVTDLDQVLVKIDNKWILEFVKNNMSFFTEKGMTVEEVEDKILDPQAIKERTGYYVNDFMGFDKNTSDYYSRRFFETYTKGDFYGDLHVSEFGEVIQEMLNRDIASVYIISHVLDGKDSDSTLSKKRFIEKNFPKAGYCLTPSNIPKSFVINEKGLQGYDVFVDDLIPMIEEVFLHTYSIGKQYAFPAYGYNKNYDYLLEPIEKNMSGLVYFEMLR